MNNPSAVGTPGTVLLPSKQKISANHLYQGDHGIGERRESRDNGTPKRASGRWMPFERQDPDRIGGDAPREGGAPRPVGAPGLVNRCILGRGPARPDRIQDRLSTVRIYHADVRIWREPLFQDVVKSTRGGLRGDVVQFSKATARRLRWFVRNCPQLNAVGVTAFAHCTYPAEFPTDGRTVKLHLERLRHRLSRRGIGGVWVLEFQARGAPHLHMILTGSVDKLEFSRMWFEVVGSGDPKHLAAGTRIEPMEEPHGAARYVAGYCSKLDQKTVPEGFEGVGRFWGHWGGIQALPVAMVESTTGKIASMVRTLRRAANSERSAAHREAIRRALHDSDHEFLYQLARESGRSSKNWVVVGPVWRTNQTGRVIMRGPHWIGKWEQKSYGIRPLRKVRDRGFRSFSLYGVGGKAVQFLKGKV